MKIEVTMKCPDALDNAIIEASENEDDRRAANLAARKWFRYGEYLTVQIDTEAGTATVVEI